MQSVRQQRRLTNLASKLNNESNFSVAPPGYSLTGPKGQYAWEKPPEHATPNAAVDAIIDNLEKQEVQENMVQLMFAGVSIEELVSTMTKVGFMEGKFSVDVAEIIKAPLSMYLMGLATEANIQDVRVFNTYDGLPRTDYGMKDSQILNIMRNRNPNKYEYVTAVAPQQIKEERARRDAVKEERADSFLEVKGEE